MQAIELVEGRYENVKEAQVIEHFDGYYEAQEIPFGVVYRWCPESFVVQCGCGRRPVLTATLTTCSSCEANHIALVRKRQVVQPLMTDETRHPWLYAEGREGLGLPY
jgi:hypothetical protein